MSQQSLGMRRSLQIARRHKMLIGAAAIVGLVGGVGYAVLNPPAFTSQALVVLQMSASAAANATGVAATESVVVTSDPVLSNATNKLGSGLSPQTLRSQISVSSATSNVLAITANGRTAELAQNYANAVSESFVQYSSSNSGLVNGVTAQTLQPAPLGAGGSKLKQDSIFALLGLVAGALIGFVVALAISRGDRRLRERDEIANSIGMPVLASIPVLQPADPAGWMELLVDYEPGLVDAWKFRKVIEYLGVTGLGSPNGNGNGAPPPVIAVLTIASDRKALALGPQLATFAASKGIRTALILGAQQDTAAIAQLRAACAAYMPASPRRTLRVFVPTEPDFNAQQVGADLTVLVVVVDPDEPEMRQPMRSTVTLLGVSAGAASAEELARAVAAAADAGSYIAGILVADPEPSDQTTGLDPHLGKPIQRRMPTRLNGVTPAETRR